MGKMGLETPMMCGGWRLTAERREILSRLSYPGDLGIPDRQLTHSGDMNGG